MKVLKTIVKVALSIGGIMLLGGAGDLFSTIFVFAAFYGLITYYMFSFANGGAFFIGDGLISMAFAMIINLALPALILVAPMFLLEAILPGEIGTIIYGIVIIAACVGCILSDLLHIVRIFNPGFLRSFGDISDSAV